jgi:hypothetical protein
VLDQTLCDFTPFGMMRTFRGIRSKAGKNPQFRFAEGTAKYFPSENGRDPVLRLDPMTQTGLLREVGRLPDGRVSPGGQGKRWQEDDASVRLRALESSPEIRTRMRLG